MLGDFEGLTVGVQQPLNTVPRWDSNYIPCLAKTGNPRQHAESRPVRRLFCPVRDERDIVYTPFRGRWRTTGAADAWNLGGRVQQVDSVRGDSDDEVEAFIRGEAMPATVDPQQQHHHGSRTDQLPEVHPQCPGTLSRVFKALQQISVMTHNKIKALADFAPARVAQQNQLCALQQKRGLGLCSSAANFSSRRSRSSGTRRFIAMSPWYQNGTRP